MFELQNERTELLEKIEELFGRKRYAELRDLLLPMEAADIASLCQDLDEKVPVVFRLLPKELAAEVFVELDSDDQELLIHSFSNTELKEVLDELYLDDAADIVEEMPAGVVKRILRHCDPEMRKSINEVLKYPEDSAGSIMTTEFVDLKANMTVEDALKRIRRTGPDKETINICYVIDDRRHLIGLLTIRTLLLAEEDRSFLVRFYMHALAGMMIGWMAQDMREEPEDLVAQTARLLDGDLRRKAEQFAGVLA